MIDAEYIISEQIRLASVNAKLAGSFSLAICLDALREHLEAGTVGELAMLIERGRGPVVEHADSREGYPPNAPRSRCEYCGTPWPERNPMCNYCGQT